MTAHHPPPAPAPPSGEADAAPQRCRCGGEAPEAGEGLRALLAQLRQARIMEIRAIERYLGIKPAKVERY